jgi:hypothetical protein
MKLNETFDNAVDYTKKRTNDGDFITRFDLNPVVQIKIELFIRQIKNDKISVNFLSFGSGVDMKDKGQSTYKIFSTITQIIQDHVEEYDIQEISATANNDKKADIYEKLLNRFANGWDVYRYDTFVMAVKKYS